jgi:hypothetical protein
MNKKFVSIGVYGLTEPKTTFARNKELMVYFYLLLMWQKLANISLKTLISIQY